MVEKLINGMSGSGGAYGAVLSEPIRADGYCLLINKELYAKYQLDENFQWWWSVTKLEAQILNEGGKIVAFKNHENMLHHFGGKSGQGYKDAKGMDISVKDVKEWFHKGCVEIKEII